VTDIKLGELMEEEHRADEEDRYFRAKTDEKMGGFEEMETEEEYGASKQEGGGGGGGVLGAITETLAEIGQTTTHLILGQPQPQPQPQPQRGYEEQEVDTGVFGKKQQ
jgi:hypothetical protein